MKRSRRLDRVQANELGIAPPHKIILLENAYEKNDFNAVFLLSSPARHLGTPTGAKPLKDNSRIDATPFDKTHVVFSSLRKNILERQVPVQLTCDFRQSLGASANTHVSRRARYTVHLVRRTFLSGHRTTPAAARHTRFPVYLCHRSTSMVSYNSV